MPPCAEIGVVEKWRGAEKADARAVAKAVLDANEEEEERRRRKQRQQQGGGTTKKRSSC